VTREEFAAVVDEVLDTPRTVPGRKDTIMRAADLYAVTFEGIALHTEPGEDVAS
jgi:hypothetical protein